MVYAPGEPSDEKLHAAHHASVMKGFRFQVMGCTGLTIRKIGAATRQAVTPIKTKLCYYRGGLVRRSWKTIRLQVAL